MELAKLVVFVITMTFAVGQQCNSNNCQLPDCFCAGRVAPGALQSQNVPQMVMLSFDDEVDGINFPFYTRLLRSGRDNPNGCPITASFFVSNNLTEYRRVEDLHNRGHEIGSHSNTHRYPIEWWSRIDLNELRKEFEKQRQNIVDDANVPFGEVRGTRQPFLETNRRQIDVLQLGGFKYDSTFLVGPLSASDFSAIDPNWPYTLDFPPPTPAFCERNCPTSSFPGLWEIPINRWQSLEGGACSYLDNPECEVQGMDSKEGVLDYFRRNFERFYNRNRAPFGMHLHGRWLKQAHRLDALDDFIKELLTRNDVYIVTHYQVNFQFVLNSCTQNFFWNKVGVEAWVDPIRLKLKVGSRSTTLQIFLLGERAAAENTKIELATQYIYVRTQMHSCYLHGTYTESTRINTPSEEAHALLYIYIYRSRVFQCVCGVCVYVCVCVCVCVTTNLCLSGLTMDEGSHSSGEHRKL